MNGMLIGTVIIMIISLLLLMRWMCQIKRDHRFTVYGYMKCPYTVKMLDELTTNDHAFTFVDVHTPVGHEEFKQVLDGRTGVGVPYTIDHKTGKHMLGYNKIKM